MSSKILCLVPLWCHRIRLPQCFNAQLPIVFRDCQWHPSAQGLLHLAQLWWWCHQPGCQQPSWRQHRIVLPWRNRRWRKHQQRWWWKLQKCVNPNARCNRCLCPLHHLLHQKLVGHRLAVSFLQLYLKLSEKSFVVRCENSGCQDANQKEALFLPRQPHNCWKWSYCEDMVQWCSESFNLFFFMLRRSDVMIFFFSYLCFFWLLIVLLQLFSQAKSPLLDPMSHGRFFRPVQLGSFIIFIGQFVHLLPFYFTLNAVILAGQHDAEMILRSALLKSMVTAGASRCWSNGFDFEALLTEIWCFIIKQCSWF